MTERRALNVDGNAIDVGGARALAEAIQNPQCTLRSLELCHNDIREGGARALADARWAARERGHRSGR